MVALAAAVMALGSAGGAAPPTAAASPAPSAPPSGGLPSLPLVSWAPADSAPASLPPIAGPSASLGGSVGVVARRIKIERLGIDLPIVEGDGYEAPMYKAAHYPGTGWPHGGVNIYIYAHAQVGMFLALWGAQPGDVVTLELADGSEALYQVTDVLPKVAWNAMQYTDPTPPERLTLQTSTGNTAVSPRFIVLAEPMGSTGSTASPSAVP